MWGRTVRVVVLLLLAVLFVPFPGPAVHSGAVPPAPQALPQGVSVSPSGNVYVNSTAYLNSSDFHETLGNYSAFYISRDMYINANGSLYATGIAFVFLYRHARLVVNGTLDLNSSLVTVSPYSYGSVPVINVTVNGMLEASGSSFYFNGTVWAASGSLVLLSNVSSGSPSEQGPVYCFNYSTAYFINSTFYGDRFAENISGGYRNVTYARMSFNNSTLVSFYSYYYVVFNAPPTLSFRWSTAFIVDFSYSGSPGIYNNTPFAVYSSQLNFYSSIKVSVFDGRSPVKGVNASFYYPFGGPAMGLNDLLWSMGIEPLPSVFNGSAVFYGLSAIVNSSSIALGAYAYEFTLYKLVLNNRTFNISFNAFPDFRMEYMNVSFLYPIINAQYQGQLVSGIAGDIVMTYSSNVNYSNELVASYGGEEVLRYPVTFVQGVHTVQIPANISLSPGVYSFNFSLAYPAPHVTFSVSGSVDIFADYAFLVLEHHGFVYNASAGSPYFWINFTASPGFNVTFPYYFSGLGYYRSGVAFSGVPVNLSVPVVPGYQQYSLEVGSSSFTGTRPLYYYNISYTVYPLSYNVTYSPYVPGYGYLLNLTASSPSPAVFTLNNRTSYTVNNTTLSLRMPGDSPVYVSVYENTTAGSVPWGSLLARPEAVPAPSASVSAPGMVYGLNDESISFVSDFNISGISINGVSYNATHGKSTAVSLKFSAPVVPSVRFNYTVAGTYYGFAVAVSGNFTVPVREPAIVLISEGFHGSSFVAREINLNASGYYIPVSYTLYVSGFGSSGSEKGIARPGPGGVITVRVPSGYSSYKIVFRYESGPGQVAVVSASYTAPFNFLFIVLPVGAAVAAAGGFFAYRRLRSAGSGEAEVLVKCPYCNSDIPVNSSVCPVCKRELDERELVCMNCNSRVPKDADYCHVCGNILVPPGSPKYRYLEYARNLFQQDLKSRRAELESRVGRRSDSTVWELVAGEKDDFVSFETFLQKLLRENRIKDSVQCRVCCHVNPPGTENCQECGAPLF